ncbi:ACP S-malonyltransferase [Listeria sp. PSOL-1]|uniref:ACP S-malonyltransferase n=1 Tax=Listeria sp. PSOL-1 TaxID=1844999 RepID=UPI0013D29807|nr:acyltransferase domain-containing protein [Listeria sp. PSOL-1]
MSLAFIFAGQGSQKEGMLAEVPNDDKKLVFQKVGVLLPDTAKSYQSTVVTQLSLLLLETFQAKELVNAGFIPEQVAGHSIGAYPAAVIAGVLSLEEAIQLVYIRSTQMEKLFPSGYGMAVIVGLEKKELEPLIQKLTKRGEILYLANQNAAQQFTVSGENSALTELLTIVQKNGAPYSKKLNITVPSHSPLMKPAVKELKQALAKVELQEPSIKYVTNYSARSVQTKAAVCEDLSENLVHPVLWDEMTDVLIENGGTLYVEFGPGNTLSKLIQAKSTEVKAVSISQIGISGTKFFIRKWGK